MRVLVTFGSKHGGTAGIAEVIGDELAKTGHEPTVVPATEMRPPQEFVAVVIGGALYSARWQRDARRYVARFRSDLRKLPVWFFSSGPLDGSAVDGIAPTHHVKKLMDRVRAIGHITFGGRLESDAEGFIAGAMAKNSAGDWRDEAHIRAWADEISQSLTSRHVA